MAIIVANWKMNGNIDFARDAIININEIESENDIILCPPTALLYLFENFRYNVGAQNCFYEESGAFTGETSPKLIKELGCKYVLLGHSERRTIFNEDNDIVFKKWEAAIANNLIPIFCIGEKSEDRQKWKDVLSFQLKKFLNINLHKTIFAYEPIWSIGTGKVPSLDEIETVAKFIKTQIKAPLLYGGSVNISNSSQILECKNVDGLLIGGASLKVEEFKKIAVITNK